MKYKAKFGKSDSGRQKESVWEREEMVVEPNVP